MKTALRISILLNLGLLGWLAFSLANHGKPVGGTEPRVVATRPPAVETPAQPLSTPALARPEPFRWNQLYARDYHVYVRNLRAIGCPEPALRAIVAADVHAVFQPRADELEKKLSELANSSWSSQLAAWNNEQVWKAELQHLPDEEAAMVADYLGEKMAATSPATSLENSDQTAAADNDDDQPDQIAMPLIAQPVDLAALNLDDGQLEAITNLQQMFLQKIGGPNQDPNDPAYLARWQAAQTEVDSLMQGMIGNQAYQEYQLLAVASAQKKAGEHQP